MRIDPRLWSGTCQLSTYPWIVSDTIHHPMVWTRFFCPCATNLSRQHHDKIDFTDHHKPCPPMANVSTCFDRGVYELSTSRRKSQEVFSPILASKRSNLWILHGWSLRALRSSSAKASHSQSQNVVIPDPIATTIPLLCHMSVCLYPLSETGRESVLTPVSSLQQSMGKWWIWIFLHDGKEDSATFLHSKTLMSAIGQE